LGFFAFPGVGGALGEPPKMVSRNTNAPAATAPTSRTTYSEAMVDILDRFYADRKMKLGDFWYDSSPPFDKGESRGMSLQKTQIRPQSSQFFARPQPCMLIRRSAGIRIRSLQCSPHIRIYFPQVTTRAYSEQQKSEGNGTETPKKIVLAEKLKQWSEVARTNGQARFAAWTTAAEQQFTLLGSKLNQLTGYELVEELKRQVVEQGTFYT
jgi:hypothetical protein